MFLVIWALFGEEGRRLVNLREIEGIYWYQGSNVCDFLGISNITLAMRNVPHTERTKIRMNTAGHEHGVWHLTEKGIIYIIMHSQSERSKMFRNLITDEFMPLAATTMESRLGAGRITIG